MPAKSEAQQRLMGMALAAKRGKGHYSEKVQSLAASMSEKQLRDFAKTKHENLPEKKAYMTNQEQAYIEGFLKRANQYGYSADEALDLLKSAAPGVGAVPPVVQPAQQSVWQRLKEGLTGPNQFNDPNYGKNATKNYYKK